MDTSPFAYEHVLRVTRQKPTSLSEVGSDAMAEARLKHHIYGPLVWLYNLIIRLAAGEMDISDVMSGAFAPKSSVKPSVKTAVDWHDMLGVKPRRHRTYSLRKRKQMMLELIRIRRLVYIEKIIYGGLTGAQRREKQARISILGRRRSYGLDFLAPRKRRAVDMTLISLLAWAVPAFAVTQGGLPMAQLPPD